MDPTQHPITGEESQGDLSSPYQALVQFYYGFNHRDIHTLADNWAQSDDVTMDNPLGEIKRGWAAIRSVYDQIVFGPAKVSVEFYDYTIHETAGMFYAVGRERGFVRAADDEMKLSIRTTRIFKTVDGRWKQVHHHGSIDDPELLARYQGMIVGISE
jgi:ketosteroid isomerase-like protein